MTDMSRQQNLVRGIVPRILLIGAGATGYHAGLALAGIGCRSIDVWDFDAIEASNLNRQLYGKDNIGEYKAEVLVGKMLETSPVDTACLDYNAVTEEMDAFSVEQKYLEGFTVIINATDNLYFHGLLHKKLCVFNTQHQWLYVSPRMSAFDVEIQTFYPPRKNEWEIFQTKEERMAVMELRSGCTSGEAVFSQAVVTTSMAAGLLAVQQVINHINEEPTHKWFRMDIETGKLESNERW